MMRLTLIACIVMIGASAYANDDVGISGCWNCDEGWNPTDLACCVKDKPTCGEGPHEITVRVERFAICYEPSLIRHDDGSGEYYRTDSVTLAVFCGNATYTVQETWTDWPECKGAKLVSKP